MLATSCRVTLSNENSPLARLVSYIVRQQGQWMTVLADKEPVVAFPQPVHPLGLAAQRRQNQTPVLT